MASDSSAAAFRLAALECELRGYGSALPDFLRTYAQTGSGQLWDSGAVIALVEPSVWDAEHFGFPIGRVSAILRPSTSPLVGAEAIRTILQQPPASEWKLTVSRPLSDDWSVIHALESNGFRMVDQLVTFMAATKTVDMDTAITLRQMEPLDDSGFRAAEAMSAGVFLTSRFYNDPQFDRAKVDAMYRKWTASLFETGDVYGAFDASGLVGYVGCRRQTPNTVHIELIAVAPRARGRGVGQALVRGVQSQYADRCIQVVVGTQLSNYAAVALYTSCGFRLTKSQTTFHRWS